MRQSSLSLERIAGALLIPLLLAGILGVCGLGVTIAKDTLAKVSAIEVALGREMQQTSDDRSLAHEDHVRLAYVETMCARRVIK